MLCVICVSLVACSSTDGIVHRLPPVGSVIYCPHCDTDLYYRVAGTSRTVYRRTDYAPASYDVPVPRLGAEHICPLCAQQITRTGDDGVQYTYWRRPAGAR